MEQEQHITSFDFSLIADFFRHLDRQGPGSYEHTLKALQAISDYQSFSNIADLGCGTGAQTSVLAANTNAHITAIDLLPEMVEGVEKRIASLGFNDKVTTFQRSMDDLPFRPDHLDLIWAEGSIYNIGFENGFRLWKQYLKQGGYIAVTETCWINDKRPSDRSYIDFHFPEITSIEEKCDIIARCGYSVIDSFVLPEYCWTKNYYEPMSLQIEPFLERHNHSIEAKRFVGLMREDVEQYQKNKEYISYVFFIAKSQ